MENLELEKIEIYLSLGVMVIAAVSIVYAGCKRGLAGVIEGCKKEEPKPEMLSVADAAQFPINGSMALFTMYVVVKYIPSNYISLLLGFYLCVAAVVALNYFVRPWVGKNVFVGLTSIAVGVLYFYTDKHWMLTNLFGVSIAVLAIQSMAVGSFSTGAILLSGLFFYDIFWVFGTDVMVSVATNIDGPIKILFPQNPITKGWDSRLSLLGLGDIVIPGFYIAFMLVYSTLGRDYLASKKAGNNKEAMKGKKHSSVYFTVAMVAYTLSLINTMFVMMYFKHAQPALLYIVPWLLITTLLTAVVKGDLGSLFEFDVSSLYPQSEEEEALLKKQIEEKATKEEGNVEDSLAWFVKDFFGLAPEPTKEKVRVKTTVAVTDNKAQEVKPTTKISKKLASQLNETSNPSVPTNKKGTTQK